MPSGMSPKVDALFAQALDLPPESRDVWLDKACGNDTALADKLRRLLDADSRAGGFLEFPYWQAGSANTACTEVSVGSQIGPYRVRGFIGKGGMGEVFLAERCDGQFEQRVAIKLLSYPTPGLLLRFKRERQILARLDHPNVARLLDGGLTEEGVPYFVMEYVEGLPIIAYCRRRALDVTARVRLFLRVCEAVHYAHQNLIVHRDLKPSNIIVSKDGCPKLLDFGIAKLLAANDDQGAQTVVPMFTPDYAAPEQISGEPITTATDVYSLGVVLYELLANQRPYHLAHGRNLELAILEVDPITPSMALAENSGSRGRRFKADLDRIVLKALAKTPVRRYGSVQLLADDLRNYLEGRPVTAVGAALPYRLRKFARRNISSVAAGLLLLICLLLGIVGIAWEAKDAREQAVHASLEAQRAHDEARRADAVRSFLVGVLDEAKPDAHAGKAITASDLLDGASKRLDEDRDSSPLVRADILDVLGELYFDIGNFDKAESLLNRAVATNEETAIPSLRERTLLDLGATAWRKGKYPLAGEYLREGLKLTQENPQDIKLVSDLHHMLDKLHLETGSPEGESGARATLAYDKAHFGDKDERVLRDLQTLSWALSRTDKVDEAELTSNDALALARELNGETHSTVASAWAAIGYIRYNRYDLQGAENASRRALDIDREVLGPDHPDTLNVESDLFMTLALEGNFREALDHYHQTVNRIKGIFGENNYDLAWAYTQLGETQLEVGQFEAGERSLNEAERIWRLLDGAGNPDFGIVRADLGRLYFLEGRLEEANAAFHEASLIVGSPSGVRRVKVWEGRTATHSGRIDDALDLLKPAVASLIVDQKYFYGGGNVDLQAARHALGEALLASDQPEAALELAKTALESVREVFAPGYFKLGTWQLLVGQCEMALKHYPAAELALREAIVSRSPVYHSADPRIAEVKLALAETFLAEHKKKEADALLTEVIKSLAHVNYPSAVGLREKAKILSLHRL